MRGAPPSAVAEQANSALDPWASAAFAGILYVGVLIDGIVTPTRRYSFLDLGLLPIPLAFGVYRIEAGPCRKAFAHGAKPALWWHPFLVIASTMLVAWFLWIVVLKLTNV